MSETEKKEEGQAAKPLDKMTVVELRETAKEEISGITGVSGMKKDQLLQTLKEARGIEDEAPAPEKKKKKGPASKKVMTAKEMKEEIVRLRAERDVLREEKDRKKLAIIRRRINRLKKKTRKAA